MQYNTDNHPHRCLSDEPSSSLIQQHHRHNSKLMSSTHLPQKRYASKQKSSLNHTDNGVNTPQSRFKSVKSTIFQKFHIECDTTYKKML